MSQTTSTFLHPLSSSVPSTGFTHLVVKDQRQVKQALDSAGFNKSAILQTSALRTLMHLAWDWAWLFAALWAVMRWGWWAVPAALLVMGNRQRALGNVLHDCGHRNVSRRAWVNDTIARYVVAPLLFADFEYYRKTHLAHHMHLGHPKDDPDYMPSAGSQRHCWRETFLANLLSPRQWLCTLAGDFAKPLGGLKLRYLALWWAAFLACLWSATGWPAAGVFLGLWLAARATVFFPITLFREMCDHFGREPGGIFRFSRDITVGGVLGWLIHPRNNGYHLTHHLLPTVPYYHLPAAHAALLKLPVFQQSARICTSYLRGPHAVVHA